MDRSKVHSQRPDADNRPKYVQRADAPFLAETGAAMTRLQINHLRRSHGLTEAQAIAISGLIWGVC